MELWIATGNKGKLKEYELLIKPGSGLILHHQGEISGFTPRPENGKSFEENARIKAKTLKAVKDKFWVMGEDSGLCVEGLNGLPGIHSARYAGDRASDIENQVKLLKIMGLKALSNRNAQFDCALVAYSPEGQEFVIKTSMKGQIARAPAGQFGFGYDPVFIPEGQTQTLAQLGTGYKNQHSHRAQAFREILQIILPKLT